MSAAGVPAFDAQADRIARAQAGDQTAFAELVDQYQTAITNYVFRTMNWGDLEDARDLTQDTIVKAWRYIGETRPGLKFGPWLYRIALNVCRDELRHRKIVRFVPMAPMHGGQTNDAHSPGLSEEIRTATTTDAGEEPEGVAAESERAAAVRAVLDRMNRRYREVLILREYGDLSYDEIAARHCTTRAAIKSTLFRAREEFRQICTTPAFQDRWGDVLRVGAA